MSSHLLFKVVAHSYLRYKNQSTTMDDCLSAITRKIAQFENKISIEVKQIAEVLSLPSQTQEHEMSVIMEQQSERSLYQNQNQFDLIGSERKKDRTTYESKMNRLKQKYNIQINKMNGIQKKIDKLIGIYKNELLQISKQMTKWQTKNQELKRQIKTILKEKQEYQLQNNQLKDQITFQSAKIIMQESQIGEDLELLPQIDQNVQSVFSHTHKGSQKKNSLNFFKQQTSKLKIKNSRNEKPIPKIEFKQQQKVQINLEAGGSKNKNGKILKKGEVKIQDVRDENKKIQVEEDMQKWRKLSKKIDQLKMKLLSYESQMEQKQEKIKKLTNQIKQLKAQQNCDQQQRRKIKTSNTTLRGEKTVLLNQITFLRKQLLQKSELAALLDAQNIQLKKQVLSFSQTIKWQSNTIEDLNSAIKVKQNKNITENMDLINTLKGLNQILYKALCDQEQHLLLVQHQTKDIDELYNKQINSLKGKLAELQMILDEKNQYIVRMKSKSTQGYGAQNINPNTQLQGQTGYLGQLVKVLTKKVADRDEIIKKMGENH